MQTLQTSTPFYRSDMGLVPISSISDVLKHIHSQDKDLVNGFIRQNVTHCPDLITITCLWFHFQLQQETYTLVESFDKMNLKDNLLRGIYAYGFEKPSAIQQRAILPIIQGNDVIVRAQAGTGKTASFYIAGLQMLDTTETECQMLTIMPTRELTVNSHNVLKQIGSYLKITTQNLVGGRPVRNDIQSLQNGAQSIAGTPGRIRHLLSTGILKLDKLKLCIIDEADECFSRGFKEQIYEIVQHIPSQTQTGCFSATMPVELLEFTKKYMRNPLQINLKQTELTLEGIKQFYVAVEKEEWKFETLCDLYECVNITQSVIYCNTRRKLMWLKDQLLSKEFAVTAIHGDMFQTEREKLLKEFRCGQTRILVTTDLLSRGLDAHTMQYVVSMIINYDIPQNKESYIYRIGRSGKYGRKGMVINFVTNDDVSTLQDLQAFYNTTIDELPMNVNELCL